MFRQNKYINGNSPSRNASRSRGGRGLTAGGHMKTVLHRAVSVILFLLIVSFAPSAFAAAEQVQIGDSLTAVVENGIMTVTGSGQTYPGPISGLGDDIKASVIEMILPDGLTCIGDTAFAGCGSLEVVSLPGTVTQIGEYAFRNCISLKRIEYAGTEAQWFSVSLGTGWDDGDGSFDIVCSDGTVYNRYSENLEISEVNGTMMVTGIGTCSDTEIRIPPYYCGNQVFGISEKAFKDITGLTSVWIPDTVVFIGSSAFEGCTGLTEAYIPGRVREIKERAFFGCSSLKSIRIAYSGGLNIGKSAFAFCTSLKYVCFGETLDSWTANVQLCEDLSEEWDQSSGIFEIRCSDGTVYNRYPDADNDFKFEKYDAESDLDSSYYLVTGIQEGCDKTELIIPHVYNSLPVKKISANAFKGKTGLTSVYIPVSVKSIGESAFEGCTGLTSVVLPSDLTAIGSKAFSGCSALEIIQLPEKIGQVESYTFENCSSLKKIVIPSAGGVGTYAFSGCSELESVVFTQDFEYISENAFGSCEKLSDVFFYGTVRNIQKSAFSRCTSLETISIPLGLESIVNYAFSESALKTVVFAGTIAQWQGCVPENWYPGSGSVRIECSDGECYIYSNGLAFSEDGLTVTDNEYCGDDIIYIPPETTVNGQPVQVTKIGESAFYGGDLSGILIPDSVTEIGNSAFKKCEYLSEISLPENLEKLGDDSFSECRSLSKITIPRTVISVGNSAFCDCEVLKTVTILSGETVFGENVFSGYSELQTVYYYGTPAQFAENVKNSLPDDVSVVYPLPDTEVHHAPVLQNDFSFVYYFALRDGTVNYDYLNEYYNVTLELQIKDYSRRDEYEYTDEKGFGYNIKQVTLDKYTPDIKDGVKRIRFSFDGIPACEIGNRITATLKAELKDKNDDSKVREYFFTDESSIADYAYGMLNKAETSPELKKLLASMLDYSAAAQMYFGYDTQHPVNLDLTSEQRDLVLYYAVDLDQTQSKKTLSCATGHFVSKSLVLGNNIELKYYMTFDEGVNINNVQLRMSYKTLDTAVPGQRITQTVNGNMFGYDGTQKRYSAKLTGLAAADAGAMVTAELWEEKNGVWERISDSVEYGVKVYCKNMLENQAYPDLHPLLRILSVYIRNAKVYFSSLSS